MTTNHLKLQTHHVFPQEYTSLVAVTWIRTHCWGKWSETAEKGAEFAWVHNCDSNDFMNSKKIERFILEKMKEMEPFHWELLDETWLKMIKKVVQEEDKGPSKELGSFGLYGHPTTLDIDKANKGKTVLSQMIPIWLMKSWKQFRIMHQILFKWKKLMLHQFTSVRTKLNIEETII